MREIRSWRRMGLLEGGEGTSYPYNCYNIGSHPSSSKPSTSPPFLHSSLSFNRPNQASYSPLWCCSAWNTDFGMPPAGGLVWPALSSCVTSGNLLTLTELLFVHLKSRVYNTHFFGRLLGVLKMVDVKNLEQKSGIYYVVHTEHLFIYPS